MLALGFTVHCEFAKFSGETVPLEGGQSAIEGRISIDAGDGRGAAQGAIVGEVEDNVTIKIGASVANE